LVSASRTWNTADIESSMLLISMTDKSVLSNTWKLGVASVELEWDIGFNVANDLRVCLGRVNHQSKNESDE
jgi:hypothetical protein